LTVRWISGHDRVVEGNELANKEAKSATKNSRFNSPTRQLLLFLCKGALLSSISTLKQAQKQSKVRWTLIWKQSP
ncbi:hypothetical protein PAXRUDRAFT_116449, partial [Paxillus rubicundulus Ve08.2h10]